VDGYVNGCISRKWDGGWIRSELQEMKMGKEDSSWSVLYTSAIATHIEQAEIF